uniref:Uncharacterized protein n=1 Tax=viral metagenome TaxID=1070528 RepID=A0A6M3IIJ7_9ZZZZ
MAKSTEEKTKRGSFICASCKNEFEGTSCNECGNAKGNIQLAQDGIEHEFHKSSHLFNAKDLRSVDEFYESDEQKLERKRIKMQMDELDDNLRESQVIRTKLKLTDQQMALRKKEIEAKRLDDQSQDYIQGKTNTPPQYNQQQQHDDQMPQMPGFMSGMSPQAVFMQQLMRMDSKKRGEFIEQLSDADPGALSNLSSMFQQSMPQQPQTPYGQPNQYGQYPMMPPWMMQQQPPQPPQKDPIELVAAIFELSKQMAPQKDDSMKESLSEFKQAIQKVHDRMDAVITKERERDSSPILEKINHLEQQIRSGDNRKSIVDQVNDLTQLVDGLEKAGLVKKQGSADKTIDDELKLKEFDFRRETENRKIQIEENKIDAEKSKANLTSSIVSSLLQRGIQKGIQAREEDNQSSSSQRTNRQQPDNHRINRVSTQRPAEVISEVETDAGIVRETRRPVKKDTIDGD